MRRDTSVTVTLDETEAISIIAVLETTMDACAKESCAFCQKARRTIDKLNRALKPMVES